MNQLSDEHRGWIAGFFEGEGSVNLRSGKYRNPRVTIMQVEREPLDWIREWTGVGKVYGPYRQSKRPSTQPYFVYSIGKKVHVEEFIAAILPLLSKRRQAQVKRVLND